MKRLEGKVAIVTGSARGTGAEIARRFVEEGARVCVSDVLDERGQAHAGKLGDAACYQHLDVRRTADWTACLDRVGRTFGPVDILVNNAAILEVGPIVELDVDRTRDILDVNLVGPMLGTQAVVSHMAGRGGAIVNLGSIDSIEGMGWVAAYCASKFGLRGFTKASALELGQKGIRVNLVCPSGGGPELVAGVADSMKKRIAAGEKIQSKGLEGGLLGERRCTPRDIANVVLFLASDEAAFCHGAEYLVDGGHTAGHVWFETS